MSTFKILQVAALLALAIAARSAAAATVSYRLELNEATGAFDLFASASAGDNAGIACYGVKLNGAVTSLNHLTPSTMLALNALGEEGSAGFSLLRSRNDVQSVFASQDTISATPHIVYGLGQTAGSFAQAGIDPQSRVTSPAWDGELRIASGFYDPAGGPIGIDYASGVTLANVFRSHGSTAAMAADIVYDPRYAAAPLSPPVAPPIVPPPFVPPMQPAAEPLPSIVDFRIELGETPGEFKLFASASGGHAGLASYGLKLTGPITSLDHVSPHVAMAENASLETGSAGFTLLRSPDDAFTLIASQDTIAPTPHILYGMGQTSGSLTATGLNPLSTVEGPSWDSDLLLATGTFDATLGSIGIDYSSATTFANVFKATGSTVVKSATVAYNPALAYIPPPPVIENPAVDPAGGPIVGPIYEPADPIIDPVQNPIIDNPIIDPVVDVPPAPPALDPADPQPPVFEPPTPEPPIAWQPPTEWQPPPVDAPIVWDPTPLDQSHTWDPVAWEPPAPPTEEGVLPPEDPTTTPVITYDPTLDPAVGPIEVSIQPIEVSIDDPFWDDQYSLLEIIRSMENQPYFWNRGRLLGYDNLFAGVDADAPGLVFWNGTFWNGTVAPSLYMTTNAVTDSRMRTTSFDTSAFTTLRAFFAGATDAGPLVPEPTTACLAAFGILLLQALAPRKPR